MSRRNRTVRQKSIGDTKKAVLTKAAPPESDSGHWALWTSVALIAVVFLLYAPVRHYGFVDFDDDLYVSVNQHVQQGLTWTGIKWAFTSVGLYYWQPFTWLSHMLDCQFFGLNPGAFHLVNVAIHAANTVLLFLIFRKLTGRLYPSAMAAALFALHPLRVESVAWIAERKDVLSAFFALLTVWAYVRYARRQHWTRYLGVLAGFACALMSKPTVVSLPLGLLVLDYWPLRRIQFGKRVPWSLLIEKAPLLVMAATVSAVTVFGQNEMGASPNLSLLSRLETALSAYVTYLGMLVWPHNLAVMYPYSTSYSAVWVVFCAVTLIVLTGSVLYCAKRYPFLCFGWFWYLVMLLPMSGLIRQAGPQALADRFTYLPSMGLLVAAVWFAAEGMSRWPHHKLAAGISALLVLGACGAASANRIPVWQDSVTLFGDAVAVAPESAISQHNLAYGLAQQSRYAEAIPHYRKALELDSNLFRADYNLGRALYEQGNLAEARSHFDKVLKHSLAPEYESDVRNALGIVLIREGRAAQAKREFLRAVQLKPNSAELHANLGACFAMEGHLNDAVLEFHSAIRLNPDYEEAHRNLGIAFSQLGKTTEALTELQTALRLSPGDRQAEHLIETLRPGDKQ